MLVFGFKTYYSTKLSRELRCFILQLIHFISFSLFSAYSCRLISLLCVVLFKTGDSSQEIREKAAQLIFILDRYINMTYFLMKKSPSPLRVNMSDLFVSSILLQQHANMIF